ncbi:MAG: RNase adapter RapZ [Eggerthellaceae bacterium]|nr:RNase adapter RapZ [Eggerthellaceae bacterium]
MGDVSNMPDLIIVSGMSGAGRSETMNVFEDMGYYCVDNLPASLIAEVAGTIGLSKRGQEGRRLAVVCDAKAPGYFRDVTTTMRTLAEEGVNSVVVFLDADDDKLVARYKSSRRRHPLCEDGATVLHGIERERALLREIRGHADFVIDTTDLLPADLRTKLNDLFAHGEERSGLSVSVYSFGFKHGAPLDADVVIDVRFLPNPYYDPVMRTMTGLDELVRNYVLYNSDTDAFLKRWFALLDCVMPGYVAEGKQQLAIAVGCTGGQHRSVALAEATGDYLRTSGSRVSVAHRDLALAVRPDGELVTADPNADDAEARS